MSKSKREREATELQGAAIRMMRALARRAGDGELEALEALAFLQDVVQLQLGAAVAGYRESPVQASWSQVGEALGITRQSAHERFSRATVAPAWPASTCTCTGHCDPLHCHHCAGNGMPEWCPSHAAGLVTL